MQTKIENENEFASVIDQYGDALKAIDDCKAEAEVLKQMLEVYAREKNVTRRVTERYCLKMQAAEPALRRMAGVSEADVVKLLKRNASSRDYVIDSYDSAALKRDLADSEAGHEQLAAFGLVLTETIPHAKVSPRKEKKRAA